MMKIAAIVITFHPQKDLFLENLRQYVDAVDKVLIWRNSEEKIDFPAEFANKIVLCGDGCNKYIAKPLNEALRWCRIHGYDFLLTMDQDSTWGNCSSFIDEVLKRNEEDVAIYAPNVNGLHAEEESSQVVESVITSGSLVRVSVACQLGGFREDYDIYWVDGEFCHRVRLNGYKIKVLTKYRLVQQFGHETRIIGGFTTANYSPIVYYYLFRNMLWMKREYKNNPSWRCVAYTTLINVRGIVLGERHKFMKLKMIAKAWRDGCCEKINRRMLQYEK